MKPTASVAALALCLALVPAAVEASTITYANFSSSAGSTLNGSAAVTGGVLRLTNGAVQAGSAWYNTLQDVGSGFDTTFQFQITPIGGFNGEPSADGFTFMIQNSPAGLTSLGAAGDGIGYGAIVNSLAIEFDTFCNSGIVSGCYNNFNGINDPNGNHVSVITGGPGNATIQLQSNALGVGTPGVVMDNGSVHTGRIIYDAGAQTLTVLINGSPVVALTSFNLASTINLNGGQAYMGFTSGTGAASATHDILSWTSQTGGAQTAVPEPGSLLLLGTGLAGLVWYRRRR